jgi:hypothetical protein
VSDEVAAQLRNARLPARVLGDCFEDCTLNWMLLIEQDWDTVQTYPEKEWICPGDTVTAYVAFLSPE